VLAQDADGLLRVEGLQALALERQGLERLPAGDEGASDPQAFRALPRRPILDGDAAELPLVADGHDLLVAGRFGPLAPAHLRDDGEQDIFEGGHRVLLLLDEQDLRLPPP
jgi:hypothetical protein